MGNFGWLRLGNPYLSKCVIKIRVKRFSSHTSFSQSFSIELMCPEFVFLMFKHALHAHGTRARDHSQNYTTVLFSTEGSSKKFSMLIIQFVMPISQHMTEH